VTRRHRIAALVAALAIPGVAALELVGEARVAARAASPAEWDEAARATASLARGGALVVVAPRWGEPHLRQRIGDDLMPLSHLARSDDARFAAAVEVGLHGERAPGLSGFRTVEETRVGPFVVRRLENDATERVLHDFVEALRPPHATVHGTDPAVRCTWSTRSRVLAGGLGGAPALPAARFECGGDPWLGVGVTVIADPQHLPRRCIWAHPFASGEKVLRFERVPLAGARRLVGHHGIDWLVERDGGGADVVVEARLDGAPLGRTVHRDGDGWVPFAFELPPAPPHAAPDRTGVFELAVSTTDTDRRHLCLEATLR
jgi:hypothetical protein